MWINLLACPKSFTHFKSLFHCGDLDELALCSLYLCSSIVTDAALGAISIIKNVMFVMTALWSSHSYMHIYAVQKSQPRRSEYNKEKLAIQKQGNG